MKIRAKRIAAAAVAGMLAGPAMAAEIYNSGGLTLNADIEVGLGGFLADNPNFGTGRVDLRSGENTGDSQHAEGFVEPSLSFTYAPGGAFELYGAGSVVLGTTVGEGDAGGFTDGTDGDVGLELANLGARLSFGGGENPWVLDVTAGRANLSIGNGWLFTDGNFDTFSDTNFWLAPRTAFRRAGILDLSNGTFGIKGFYVEADSDNDRSEVLGGDLRFTGDYGEWGILYAQIGEARDVNFARDGMEMVSVRALGVPVPGVEGLSLSAEYTEQFGSDAGNDFDANAYYGQAAYTFAGHSWAPTLTYRYAHFSGDSTPDDGNIDAFDPLFYGFTDGYGTWFQGEIVGEYLLFNSNQRNHMVMLSAAPSEALSVGAIYYRFSLDEKNYFGTPVTDRHFADEINLFADYTLSENVFLSAVAGVAFPGDGAEQAFGDDDNTYLLQASMLFTF